MIIVEFSELMYTDDAALITNNATCMKELLRHNVLEAN